MTMTQVGILTWDWRGQPDIERLDYLLANLTNCQLRVCPVDTGSDGYAIAISVGELDDKTARTAYERYERGGDQISEVEAA